MIKLDTAIKILEEHALKPGLETVHLEESYSKILAEDVLADRDDPPFNKSSMDGYACRHTDLGESLRILETIPAGKSPGFHVESGTCSRIMTGAEVPAGADCVIMQEYSRASEDGKTILFTGKETNLNIVYQGENIHMGELLLKKGSRLSAQNIGLLASAGKTEVKVYTNYRIGIIATGSELVEPGATLRGAEIRNSNAQQLMAQIRSLGHKPVYFGIVQDHPGEIKEKSELALKDCDILFLTGGASVGEFDHVAGVFENLGFSIKFSKVAIQPGKPVSFALKDDKVCFGLSGNPVSCFLQFELFARPYLLRSSGADYKPERIISKLDTDFSRKHSERQYFLPVHLSRNGFLSTTVFHGSAHLHGLTDIIGFAEIPVGTRSIKKGEEVYVRLI